MRPERLLPALALLSGWCGIAYELLYGRVLTSHLGDTFHVNAAILTSFLLGIGVGSYLAHRVPRWLWAIELGIGLYAALAAAALFAAGDRVLEAAAALGGAPAAVVAEGVALTLVPALLVGTSVPLFALYLRHHAPGAQGGLAFHRVYRLYNAGAAACVLAMELLLLRQLGLRLSLILLALVNVASGLLLRRVPAPAAPAPAEAGPASSRAQLAALALASALSGLFQLFFLKLTETVFGPFHENFAVLLALALAGIAAGSAWVERRRPTFAWTLALGALVVGLSLAALRPWVHLWGTLNAWLGVSPAMSALLKLLVLAGMGGLPFAVFGATVPALVGEDPDRRQAGRLLAISSFGNCAGYLLATLVLYQRLSYGALAAVFTLGLGACAALAAAGPERRWRRLALPALGAAALLGAWDEPLWGFSYREYLSPASLAAARKGVARVEVLRHRDTEVKLVTTRSGEVELLINGYRSLVAARSGQTNRKELVVGAAPAMYAARREHALVLGVGTGISAGAAASLFRRTTGVELNPAVVAALPRFESHNLGLASRPGFELVVDDGLSFLARTPDRYDAIINTVTSPLFFSSSKLYTRELFDLARSRLAPGGVYAMWLDARVTEAGARLIFETLRRSFADCDLVFLAQGYSQLICGAGPLAPRPLPAEAFSPELARSLGAREAGMEPPELLERLALRGAALTAQRWSEEVNTLDRPRLEFAMASTSLEEGLRGKPWTPYQLAQVPWAVSPFTRDTLPPEGLERRCLAVRLMEGLRVHECERLLVDAGTGALPARYLEALAALPPAAGGRAEQLRIADQLLKAGRPDRALAIIQPLKAELETHLSYEELRVRALLEAGHTPSGQDLARLYLLGPIHPGARRLLARSAARLGHREEALAHARLLGRLGPLTPEDRALVRSLEGAPAGERAQEGPR